MVSYAQLCQQNNSHLAESFKWYSKAAKLSNNMVALRELGRMYAAHKGDFKTSADYYRKASILNDPLATLVLGGYYEKGQGVPLNTDTALTYYTKAIELGHPT